MAFDGSSVTSSYPNSITTCSLNHQNNSPTTQNPTNRGVNNFNSHSPCFLCQKIGHWMRDCPTRTPNKSEPSTPLPIITTVDGFQCSSIFLCHLCSEVCLLLTSRTDLNPGRKFYRCPKDGCRFFKWFDKVKENEMTRVPICGCGAGPCRVSTQADGPNAGCKFFICPIKKGQGACDFFEWQDRNIVKQGDLTHSGLEIQSPGVNDTGFNGVKSSQAVGLMEAPQCPPNHKGYEPSEGDKAMVVEFRGHEETSNDLLRKPCKRLRHGAPKIDGSVFDSFIGNLDMLMEKSGDLLTEEEEVIHHRQTEFWRQISIAGTTFPEASSASSCSFTSSLSTTSAQHSCLLIAGIPQNLGLHFRGWWGRLAFPPSRCLAIPAPKPFFFCVFPSFDPIPAPSSVRLLDIESTIPPPSKDSSSQSLGQDAQASSVVFREPLKFRSSVKIVRGHIMENSALEAFRELALRFQKELLVLLESMEFNEHGVMVKEAQATFDALDRLFVDYQPFRQRVEEFIRCASSLAEIEFSIHNDHFSRELLDWHNAEKKRLHAISSVHAKVEATLKTSREHLQLLRTEVSHARDLLSRKEAHLACYEEECRDLETSFGQISKDMEESRRSVSAKSKEAEAAAKLCQQREVECNAAKAAFEKAKAHLAE